MFDALKKAIEVLNNNIFSLPMVVMLSTVGIILTQKSKFFQIKYFIHSLKVTLGSLLAKNEGSKSAFKAMSVALGGTIGVGNIAGVSAAIAIGGPGAVFWMWVSGILGMITKFGEVFLAVKFKETDEKGVSYGGPMIYMVKVLGRKFKPLSIVFSLAGIFTSLGLGNMIQVNTAAVSINSAFSIPKILVGTIFLLISSLIIIGKTKRISDFCGIFVPIMSGLYILLSLVIIVKNCGRVPTAIVSVFSSAFGFKSALGGFSGAVIKAAIINGFSKGLFSNEAGMGSSPIAHASADGSNPITQGFWGMFEVFADTIVVCTLTAMAVLTSDTFAGGTSLSGVELTTAVFKEVFGAFGEKLLSVSITLFAFATVIGWAFYGKIMLKFLNKSKVLNIIFSIIFVLVMPYSSVMDTTIIWGLTDIANVLMLIPNVLALVLMNDIIIEGIKEYKNGKMQSLSKKM